MESLPRRLVWSWGGHEVGGTRLGGATTVIDKRPVVVTHFLPNTSAPELLHYGAAGRHARLAALSSAVVFF